MKKEYKLNLISLFIVISLCFFRIYNSAYSVIHFNIKSNSVKCDFITAKTNTETKTNFENEICNAALPYIFITLLFFLIRFLKYKKQLSEISFAVSRRGPPLF